MDKEPEKAPFFKTLKKFALTKADMWSTPGHAGGLGFKETETGREFYEFFGRNIFRADVSSSVASLGAILDHEGAADEAEKEAARVFGADTTFFVLNGTSTSNKVAFFSAVAPGDVVLVGRNCHKSIIHSIILNEAIPIYLKPAKNSYGIIGPVPQSEFSYEAVRRKIKESPLITNKRAKKVQMTVLTNSTYDGLIYDTERIQNNMADLTLFMHFDEAWYAYARFHPFYEGRYAMAPYKKKRGVRRAPVFAAQSTHKLLAAFSQASMLHFRQGTGKNGFDLQGLKEAHLMHSSTSPFYPMFASLDVATGIMEEAGQKLVDEALDEALKFRREIIARHKRSQKEGSWYYEVWQPEMKKIGKNNGDWIINGGEAWHGFEGLENENVLLDPLKVTLLAPGLEENGDMLPLGIPASVVSGFLASKNIVPEKTGFYNILFLFAPGVSGHKTERLLKILDEFKRLHESNAPLGEVFPDLCKEYPEIYKPGAGLKDLCGAVHDFLYINRISYIISRLYMEFPKQALAPHKAFYMLAEGKTEYLTLDEIAGRISTFMILPYPPGIPLIMPGERFGSGGPLLEFLKMSEKFDNAFPGFSTEFHGIKKTRKDAKIQYLVNCLRGKYDKKNVDGREF